MQFKLALLLGSVVSVAGLAGQPAAVAADLATDAVTVAKAARASVKLTVPFDEAATVPHAKVGKVARAATVAKVPVVAFQEVNATAGKVSRTVPFEAVARTATVAKVPVAFQATRTVASTTVAKVPVASTAVPTGGVARAETFETVGTTVTC